MVCWWILKCGSFLVGVSVAVCWWVVRWGGYVGACKSNRLLVGGAIEGFVGGLGGKKVG